MPPGQTLAGMWEFPGGKREPGETPQACIVRDLREELCVEFSAGEVIAELVFGYPSGTIRLIVSKLSFQTVVGQFEK